MIKNLMSCGFYLVEPFKQHDELKPILLSQMEQQETHDLVVTDDYYTDNVHNLDWKQATNPDREWVKTFLPYLQFEIKLFMEHLMMEEWDINELWFQQYIKGNTHGWHSHGSNFTGVYYVELPEDSPKTELVQPFTNRIFEADIKEGDILVFPSYIVHRAPAVEHDVRKTIISFNFNMRNPNAALLEQLRM
jgi:hypothetical protein